MCAMVHLAVLNDWVSNNRVSNDCPQPKGGFLLYSGTSTSAAEAPDFLKHWTNRRFHNKIHRCVYRLIMILAKISGGNW